MELVRCFGTQKSQDWQISAVTELATLNIRLALISGLLASLLCADAYSQSYKRFPGDTVDQRTRSIQERVEAVYAAGDYERALLI